MLSKRSVDELIANQSLSWAEKELIIQANLQTGESVRIDVRTPPPVNSPGASSELVARVLTPLPPLITSAPVPAVAQTSSHQAAPVQLALTPAVRGDDPITLAPGGFWSNPLTTLLHGADAQPAVEPLRLSPIPALAPAPLPTSAPTPWTGLFVGLAIVWGVYYVVR